MLGVAKRWFNLYLSWRSYLVLGSAIALLLISSFLFSVKSVRRSLSLAHSGSLDSYATQCVRLDLVDLWSFSLAFFYSERPALYFGVELIERERNKMEMCTKETKSRVQLNFTTFFLYFRKIFFKWKLRSPNLIYIFNKIIFDNWDWGIWIPTSTNIERSIFYNIY